MSKAIGAWIGEQAVLALVTQAVQFSSVAFWGHIGGFLSGASLTALLLTFAPQLRTRGDQTPIVRVVRGTVRDSTRRPLTDARFELIAHSGLATIATTDTRGRFSMPPVAEGTYKFRVSKQEFQSIEGTLMVVRRHKRSSSVLQFTMSAVGEQVAVAKAEGAPA
jgi:Carboxypeptidase regulatory-like domain